MNEFTARLLDGERVDLLGEIARRYGFQKANGEPNARARKIAEQAVASIEASNNIVLQRKRDPRGYEIDE